MMVGITAGTADSCYAAAAKAEKEDFGNESSYAD